MTTLSRQSILKRLIMSGYQISPDALDFLLSIESPLQVIENIINNPQSDCPMIISKDFLLAYKSEPSKSRITRSTHTDSESESEMESDIEFSEWRLKIIKNPTADLVGSGGTAEDFLHLFQDRFRRIQKIYMKRIDTRTALSPAVLRKMKGDAKRRKAMYREGKYGKRPGSQKTIGMITSKRESQSKNIIVQLEDSDGSITCIIPSGRSGIKGRTLIEKGNALLLDEVVCISGFVDNDARLIADDIIYPDIPTARTISRAKRDIYAAFISDLHFGSEEFLEDSFNEFIDWLRGVDVDEPDKPMNEQTHYLFIAGDMVDGIGVYPGQEKNLLVPDLYEQYSLLAKKLRDIPSKIKIICIPGNHDACRQALPKPPIPVEFAEPLYELNDQILMLGDPCIVSVEGTNILVTHGDSLDDLVTNIPGASYKQPEIPMKELLRKRHLAPLYGSKTELAPLPRDWMVIETPPDVVHFGHAHHNAVDNYRGVQIINSGTFQGQTDFMRKQGIIPTPGIVTFLNLRNGFPSVKPFFDFSEMHV
ncbi:MAG: DNA-directed DNA polymerase II small subunit [Candidatus Lokiarchaeota archaeon]|nr:DNA-directed DNA polymerase II small subunit [Candidatus Lokiarchaeota archaeon]